MVFFVNLPIRKPFPKMEAPKKSPEERKKEIEERLAFLKAKADERWQQYQSLPKPSKEELDAQVFRRYGVVR